MRNLNKVFFGLGLSVLILGSSAVRAQNADAQKLGNRNGLLDQTPSINPIFMDKPQVILFKIHDIKPVLNLDGEVESCNFTATFYNRTPVNIRQAKIQLGWTDKISERYPIEGELPANTDEAANTDQQAQDEQLPSAQLSSALHESLGTFQTSLNIPSLASLKQVSVQGEVKTDKCFALFDNIKFNVPVCNILGQDTAVETRRGRLDADKDQLNCASLFAYVNSKHPEYYSEFKKISYEEQVQQEKTQEENEKEAIDTIGKTIEKSFRQTNNILEAIK